jgi:hypothetical protein
LHITSSFVIGHIIMTNVNANAYNKFSFLGAIKVGSIFLVAKMNITSDQYCQIFWKRKFPMDWK